MGEGMPFTTDVHPNTVLTALLSKGPRAQVQRTLNKLHEICRKQHETGAKDFSISTIGRIAEEQGIIKGRVLYNASSRNYKELIQAWAAYIGPSAVPLPKSLASHSYLMRIDDPAIRSIVQAIIAERDVLRAQLNMLKASTIGTIDMRPIGATIVPNLRGATAILEIGAQLTESEREALEKAISPAFLEAEDWEEGPHGEIWKKKGGRVIFLHGFASAIRRIIGESK